MENWNEMAPKDQRKERERLRRAKNKLNKKQEQEMRKKARLTPYVFPCRTAVVPCLILII